jgi:hypothetical protein
VASINFEVHGGRGGQKGGPPQSVTGIDTTTIPQWETNQRVINVTPVLSNILKVPTGQYEHVSTDASGNWTYAPANR